MVFVKRTDLVVRISIVILAAGASRRFGTEDKLLASVGGEPIVVRLARRMAAVRVDGARFTVRAVTRGPDDPVTLALRALSEDVRPRVVFNPHAEQGMASSIIAGLGSPNRYESAAVFVPGDMPLLTSGVLMRLIEVFLADDGARPTHPVLPDGSRVGPVVWPRSWFPRLKGLTGDAGGRGLLTGAETAGLPFAEADAGLLRDVDTVADLAAITGNVGHQDG